MPGNLLMTDTAFPQFHEGQSSEQKLDTVMNYLFMLREQLRYCMSNLGEGNFNDTELALMGEHIVEGVSGEVLQLKIDAQQMQVKIEAGETEDFLLWMTADELGSELINTQGQVSQISQKVDSISLSVKTEEGVASIVLGIDGKTQAGTIDLTGLVTFSDLESDGKTKIHGGNITTGKITAVDIEGVTISGCVIVSEDETWNSRAKMDGGSFRLESEAGTRYAVLGIDGLGTACLQTLGGYVLKLISDKNMSIDANGIIYIGSSSGYEGSGVQIGAAGRDVHLVGNVYINGTLYGG